MSDSLSQKGNQLYDTKNAMENTNISQRYPITGTHISCQYYCRHIESKRHQYSNSPMHLHMNSNDRVVDILPNNHSLHKSNSNMYSQYRRFQSSHCHTERLVLHNFLIIHVSLHYEKVYTHWRYGIPIHPSMSPNVQH